jgi:hypothetical protein
MADRVTLKIENRQEQGELPCDSPNSAKQEE